MRLNWTDFRRKCQFPLLMVCGTLPAALIAQIILNPEGLGQLWLFPVSYLPLALACLVIPGKRRLIAGIVSCLLVLGMSSYLLPVATNYLVLVIPLIYVILLLATLPIGGWAQEDEIHMAWYAIGIGCHVFGQVAVNVAQRTGKYPDILAVSPVLILSFIGFALLSLLSLNRNTMSNASMGRQRIPALMRHRNTLLTIGLLALVLLLSAMPAVITAVQTAWDWLLSTIIFIFRKITEFLRGTDTGGGSSGGGTAELSALSDEIAEPSLLAQILEKVMFVLAGIAAVVLLFLALRFLWRKLKILLRYLWKRLTEYAASTAEDFEDEITDTREGGERERVDILTTLRKRLVRVDEKKLAPAERIRYRYLRLLIKHPEWSISQTARENLPTDTAQLYELARYSGQEVSAQEAEDFANRTKTL